MASSSTKAYIQRKTFRAKFERHNGNQDPHGVPTYPIAADWDIVVNGWPCEVQTTGGGERIRGMQVDATTTHVLTGQFSTLDGIVGADCRAVINGTAYQIVSVRDPDGLRKIMIVQARQTA